MHISSVMHLSLLVGASASLQHTICNDIMLWSVTTSYLLSADNWHDRQTIRGNIDLLSAYQNTWSSYHPQMIRRSHSNTSYCSNAPFRPECIEGIFPWLDALSFNLGALRRSLIICKQWYLYSALPWSVPEDKIHHHCSWSASQVTSYHDASITHLIGVKSPRIA